ncbi:hypothetical protein BWR18_01955 [Tateyamaria omphalii]|uniref:Peptidase M10 serralysin C-terminal domain-containing protein n=2 Tax=Tateyamaria omphalii TaxID=299262 RepID=A0A1P8MR86_9RHOB|nr:hypothetical protein BWR18_01955 [Tateyamaria omphalii]
MLRGGDGNDVLEGGADSDDLWGGNGADRFVFKNETGHDRVFGFDMAEDVLDCSQTRRNLDDLHIENCGRSARISLGDAEISVVGAGCEPLTEDCSIF